MEKAEYIEERARQEFNEDPYEMCGDCEDMVHMMEIEDGKCKDCRDKDKDAVLKKLVDKSAQTLREIYGGEHNG